VCITSPPVSKPYVALAEFYHKQWYFQAWSIRTYAQILYAVDVLKLRFGRRRFHAMPSVYASALDEAKHTVNPIVNPKMHPHRKLHPSVFTHILPFHGF
jgi:hypothetical protein